MSFKFKLFFIPLLVISFFVLSLSVVESDTDFTTSAELSLYPSEGTVEQGDDFTLDILVDTKGQEVLLVRAVLKFNPELVQLETVVENEGLFCDWPSAEQMIDNESGLVMITGFCQSGGEEELYATTGDADILTRLTFDTIQSGELLMEWEYSGIDEPMKSVIISDGSPPQNILEFDEGELTYTYTIDPKEEVKMPETNISPFDNLSSTFVLGGSIFMLALFANFLLDPKRRYFSKSRTVVVYDDGEK